MMLIKLQNISNTTVDVPGKGMVLKPGGTMWANDPTAELQTAIEGGFLEVVDQVGGPSSELLDRYVAVAWDDPEIVDPTTRQVVLRLKNLVGGNVAASHVLRLTCDDRASMTNGERGTVLSGDESDDLIIRTDSEGIFDLVVTCDQSITVSIAAGPTQMSPMLDCSVGCEVSFT